MVGGVSARRGLERFLRPVGNGEGPCGENIDQFLELRTAPLVVDRGAVPAQLIRSQEHSPVPGDDALGRNFEVVADAADSLGFAGRTSPELVGRLVRREPHVAVRAEQAQRPELVGEFGEQRSHRCANVVFVAVLVRLPERFRVVRLQLGEELEETRRKALERAH